MKKVEFTSDDQIGQVVVKIAELAKEVAKAPFVPFATVVGAKDTEFDAVLYEGSFDPLSSKEVKRINDVLKVHDSSLSIGVVVPGKGRYIDQVADVADCRWSICFRRPIIVELSFRSEKKEFQRISLVVPDKSRIGGIDIERAALVKKATTVEFVSGMLKSVSVTKPSEALAVVQVPIDVAKAILSIPGEIVRLKIDTTKDSTALHTARLDELKATTTVDGLQVQNGIRRVTGVILPKERKGYHCERADNHNGDKD